MRNCKEVDPKSCTEYSCQQCEACDPCPGILSSEQETPISEHNEEQEQQVSPYNLALFCPERTERAFCMNASIERVDQMMEEGLLEEVKALKERGCHTGNGIHAGTWIQRDPGLSGRRISS